jgi:hypothetical protein
MKRPHIFSFYTLNLKFSPEFRYILPNLRVQDNFDQIHLFKVTCHTKSQAYPSLEWDYRSFGFKNNFKLSKFVVNVKKIPQKTFIFQKKLNPEEISWKRSFKEILMNCGIFQTLISNFMFQTRSLVD